MGRRGYDTTNIPAGAPGREGAQNRRNASTNPRATDPGNPAGPSNNSQPAFGTQTLPVRGPRPSEFLDPNLALQNRARCDESTVRNHLAENIHGPRVPPKGKGKKKQDSSGTSGATGPSGTAGASGNAKASGTAGASTDSSGQVGRNAMSGKKRPPGNWGKGQQSEPKKPANNSTMNNSAPGGPRTLEARNVFPGQSNQLPADPILRLGGRRRPPANPSTNTSFLGQPYANTPFGNQPFIYPQVPNNQNFPFDAPMDIDQSQNQNQSQNGQTMDPALLTLSNDGLNGFGNQNNGFQSFNSPNMANENYMGQGYGSDLGFTSYGPGMMSIDLSTPNQGFPSQPNQGFPPQTNQGFPPQPNAGRAPQRFGGINPEALNLHHYFNPVPSPSQMQQQAQTNNFPDPSNAFGNNYNNNTYQQNMQSGAQGNTPNNQGFVDNFQPQAQDPNIWGQQSMSNIDPQLQPASPATSPQPQNEASHGQANESGRRKG